MEETRADGELKGNSLKMYRYILRARRPARLNEIQRALNLSGLSLAQYHANKLVGMGLIKEEQAGYVVEKVIIQNVFRIRRTLIPFQLAYAVFFGLTLTALFLLLQKNAVVSAFDLIAISVNVVALTISLYQMRQILNGLL